MKRFCLSAAFAILASFAPAQTATVIECERDPAFDYWASSDVKFCTTVMNRVFGIANVQPQFAGYRDDGRPEIDAPEVICSTFRTPKLLRDYDFPLQPLGKMHYALYAVPSRAEEMLSIRIADWPRMKVGYSPVSQGQTDDMADFFRSARLTPSFVEYARSAEAVEALHRGEIDVLFLYTPMFGKRPKGLVEVVPIGARNIYFAVRKDKPELFRKLSSAYRDFYIDHIDEIDKWREEMLGTKKPKNRVRIAAYSRGSIFNVSPDGEQSGLVDEWLDLISGITQWVPDFVYGGFAESLHDVAEGRLDIIGGLTYNPDRREKLLYPHISSGMMRTYLWVHQNSRFNVDDPSSWKGIRVGMLASANSAENAKRLFEKNAEWNIRYTEYATDDEMLNAFKAGEIDACIEVEMPEMDEYTALHLFTSNPMYICVAPDKGKIFTELENALGSISDDYSKYLRLIREQRYGIHSNIESFTIQELEWLKKFGKKDKPVMVDFSPWPFEVFDGSGAPAGLVAQILERLSTKTGLKFKASPQTDLLTAEANFMRGETDLWIPYPAHPKGALYGARQVFSVPVPESVAKFYGSDNVLREFGLFAKQRVPEQLVSIIHKAVASMDSHEVQEMFLHDMAERTLAYRIFGLTKKQVEVIVIAVVAIFVMLIIVYSIATIRLSRREARSAKENAKIAKEHAEAKTRFLAMMSHELRTPLNAVIGFAEFLGKEGCSEERKKEYVEGILLSSKALLDLINDILDFSKLEAGAKQMRAGTCDVKKILDELNAIFGCRVQQNGVKLIVDMHDVADMPVVEFSAQGLRQILINLVGNSAKFTQRGSITVLTRWIGETRTLHIEVKDTGCGISDDKMLKLFDPFVQDLKARIKAGENSGTGLGLPIVKKMIDLAGGNINVTSNLGEGTQIAIDIPGLEIVEERKEAPATADRQAKAVPEKVLVVDDMAMNRKVLGIHLEHLGVKNVRLAENGEAALDAMKDWTPDVVLTDMWMPKMDGTQLAQVMRNDKRLSACQIVAVTADVEVGSTGDTGLFKNVLAKPVTGEKLKALFENL